MIWSLDPGDPRPLYLQLAQCVREAVARGDLAPGERLPGARELADSLDVNMHTVLRAYQDLRDEGVLELRRGRGATVRAAADPHAALHGPVDDLLDLAARLGLGTDDLTALLHRRARHRGGGPTTSTPDHPQH